jgi:hypothetical protein
MTPPKNNWTWIDGDLQHIPMTDKVGEWLHQVNVGLHTEEKDGLEDPIHESNLRDHDPGWEGNDFRWLTAEEEKVFDRPRQSFETQRCKLFKSSSVLFQFFFLKPFTKRRNRGVPINGSSTPSSVVTFSKVGVF